MLRVVVGEDEQDVGPRGFDGQRWLDGKGQQAEKGAEHLFQGDVQGDAGSFHGLWLS